MEDPFGDVKQQYKDGLILAIEAVSAILEGYDHNQNEPDVSLANYITKDGDRARDHPAGHLEAPQRIRESDHGFSRRNRAGGRRIAANRH